MVPLDPFLPLVPLEGGCEDAAKLPLDKREVFIRMLMTKISVGVFLPFSLGTSVVGSGRGSFLFTEHLLKGKFQQAKKSKTQ
jgi:hypothetical protein